MKHRFTILGILLVVFLGSSIGMPTQAQSTLPVITADNASKVETVGYLGYGKIVTHALAPDGLHIAVGTDKGVLILDTADLQGKPVFVPLDLGLRSMEYSPKGDLIACGENQGTVVLIDTKTYKIVKKFTSEAYNVDRVAFHPTDPVIAAGMDFVGTIHVWNYESGEQVASLTAHDHAGIMGLAYSADGKQLKAIAALTRIVWQNYLEIDRVTYNSNQAIEDASFNPANPAQTGFALQNYTDMIENKSDGTHELKFENKYSKPQSVAFSPDGKLLAEGWGDNIAYLRDTSSGDMITKLEIKRGFGNVKFGVVRVQFSADGTQLWTSSYDGVLSDWDVKTGKLLKSAGVLAGEIKSLAMTADGSLVAGSGNDDGAVHLWNLATRQEVARLDDGRFNMAMAFSLDGKLLATGGPDFGPEGSNTVHIWDVASTKLLLELKYHKQGITTVAFSPNGKWVASGSLDKSVRVWDAKTGIEIYTISGFSGFVNSLIFSGDGGDGGTLLTGTEDGYLSLYNAPDGKFGNKIKSTQVAAIKSVTVNNNSSEIVVADDDNAQTFNLNLNKPADPIPGYGSLSGRFSVFSPDSNLLVADILLKDQLWIIDLKNKSAVVAKITYGSDVPNGILFSPDGTLILSASRNGIIELFGVKQ